VEDGERVAQRHAGLRERRGGHRGGVADRLAVRVRFVRVALCVALLGVAVVVVVLLGIVQLSRLREHRLSEHAHNHSSSFVVGPVAEING
jgi:phage shock protein PspC (stress-responsive transcriptional regulator)